MEAKTCACRSWQINGIPCIHAAKVILCMGRKLSEYVADCFITIRWRETYSFGIKPLNGILEWPQTNRLGVIPPPNQNGNPGRPRNHDRMKSMYETGSTTKLSRANRIITCSKCKEEGHNKTTCSNETVESPPKKPRGRPKKNQGLQFDQSHFSFTQVPPWSIPEFSQGQSSQAQSSQAQFSQASRWEQMSQDQASQNQASQTYGWGRWFP
ncbi:hypothetical protein V5N11_009655 [Cardamine amara subsp. amara]|uniref:SWIM-type domain-containing protein n=1 Tax=Cardamine amara subsp. amara TaxID=228776 RepID=A0ABD0ZH44_CARAN